MSLYVKFLAKMKDDIRHGGLSEQGMLDMWEHMLCIVGEKEFNELMEPRLKADGDYNQHKSSEEAFYSFHKELRQIDVFHHIVRTKKEKLTKKDKNGNAKTFYRDVIDEGVGGHVDMLFRNLVVIDKHNLFVNVFMYYWELYQKNKDVPVYEFVFDGGENDWSQPKGLIGIRIQGEEDFWPQEKIKAEFPIENFRLEICEGINDRLREIGELDIEKRNYVKVDSPYYMVREINKVLGYELKEIKPFRWVNTYVYSKQEKE